MKRQQWQPQLVIAAMLLGLSVGVPAQALNDDRPGRPHGTGQQRPAGRGGAGGPSGPDAGRPTNGTPGTGMGPRSGRQTPPAGAPTTGPAKRRPAGGR